MVGCKSVAIDIFWFTQIDSVMEDDELAVFFQVQPFKGRSTKGSWEFLLVATDEAFNSHRFIVWQTLLWKDELFFTGDFVPVFLDDSTGSWCQTLMSDDYLLMKQLQEEDDMLRPATSKLYNKPWW